MILEYNKNYVCKYCGSEDVGEYYNQELDYETYRCNNCFQEDDVLENLLIEAKDYRKMRDK